MFITESKNNHTILKKNTKEEQTQYLKIFDSDGGRGENKKKILNVPTVVN